VRLPTSLISDKDHRPVLCEEAFSHLKVRPGGVYVDATVGSGGHSARILQVSGVKVFGLDKDEQAVERAGRRFAGVNGFVAIHGGFETMKDLLSQAGISEVDGVLFDLGVSTEQLSDGERGFSFQKDGPLDMRFDRRETLTAAEILNTWRPEELEKIFCEYGEIKRPRRVVKALMQRRRCQPFLRTGDLATFLSGLIRRRGRKHPATLFFQALRIAVNRELECLRSGLEQARALLKKGGRLVVISFHSLEDRIVKQFLRQSEELIVLTRKPVVAPWSVVCYHPESRSAKLRAAEKK